MNKIHRSLWNCALGAWVAVAEITRACGKRSAGGDMSTPAASPGELGATTRRRCAARSAWLLASLAAMGAAAPAWADETINSDIIVPGDDHPSPWDISGDLWIGANGNGTLTISNGGSVSNANGAVGFSNGSGKVTVTGAGSTWSNAGDLIIGGNADGSLLVSDGGLVSNIDGVVGMLSSGTVTVTGAGSTWRNDGALVVGAGSHGQLTIADGGSVSNTEGTIGHFAGAIGEATVSGSGSRWTNHSDLVVGLSGKGTLTIAEGGTVSIADGAGPLLVAAAAGSTGVLNIGAAADSAAQAAGSLVASKLKFGAGAGSLNFNHTQSDYVFATAIEGAGQLKQIAGTTILTGNSSAFTGTTQIIGGSLAVNGHLGGNLFVDLGARLQGSGTVGSTHLRAGAVLAPGNSIGTLKVAGDLTFDAGARYEVEAQADGQSDQVQVSGKAILGGASVATLAANGKWNPLARYSILTADAGIEGTFSPLSSNFAFLTPTLDYSVQEVALTLQRNNVDFAAVGATANQRATGAGVQTLGAGALYNAVVQLDAPTARSAFEQLSGEIHASLRTALVEDSRLVREAATDRLRLTQGAVAVNGAQEAAGGAWARAYGAWGKSDSDGNAAQLDRSARGILLGGDQYFGDWRLGAFAGAGRSKVDSQNSSASINTVHLGLYGGRQWGALGLRTGLAYSRHNIDTARQLAFTGLAETARADYHAQTTQLFGELGWQMGAGVTALEPFANLAYVNLQSDGFEERGGASALHSSSQSKGVGMTTLGVRASTQWSVGSTPVSARAMLGWRHALGSVASSTSMAFAGAGSFAVYGVPLSKNVALLELGLDMALQRDLTLGLAYSGQIGRDFREQGVKANLLWKF